MHANNSSITQDYCGYQNYDDTLSVSASATVCTLAMLLIFVILVGNGIIIGVVVKHPKLRTAQNIFFCSLSVSDFTLALTVLPFSVMREMLGYWPLGAALCKVYLAIDIFLCTASIWNLCLISLNRYFALTMGRRYRTMCTSKRILTIVAVGWIWSGFVCLPGFVFSKSLASEEDTTVCTHSKETWYILFSVSGSFYIPLVIMLVAYGRISCLLKTMAQNTKIRTVTLERQKRIQLMTGIVLGAFIVCWFPFFQTYVITSFCSVCCVHPILFKFLEWFAYCNSAVNPFIYSLTKNDLRQYVNLALRNRTAVLRQMNLQHENGESDAAQEKADEPNSEELLQMRSLSIHNRMVKLPKIAWSKTSSSAPPQTSANLVRHPLHTSGGDLKTYQNNLKETNWNNLLSGSPPTKGTNLSLILEKKETSSTPTFQKKKHVPSQVGISFITGAQHLETAQIKKIGSSIRQSSSEHDKVLSSLYGPENCGTSNKATHFGDTEGNSKASSEQITRL